MRIIIFILFLVFNAQVVVANEIGRYQAVAIEKTSEHDADEVFIVDTKEGHIWVWVEQTSIPGVRQGARFIRYQGKLKPGKKIGEIIEEQEWK